MRTIILVFALGAAAGAGGALYLRKPAPAVVIHQAEQAKERVVEKIVEGPVRVETRTVTRYVARPTAPLHTPSIATVQPDRPSTSASDTPCIDSGAVAETETTTVETRGTVQVDRTDSQEQQRATEASSTPTLPRPDWAAGYSPSILPVPSWRGSVQLERRILGPLWLTATSRLDRVEVGAGLRMEW